MLGRVFDDAYRDALIKRYGDRAEGDRPEHWLIATAPDRAEQRSWLNSTLAALGEPACSRLIGRLEDRRHFRQTYAELATASILMAAGLKPVYEPDIDGTHPDLVVWDGQQIGLIVEVVSRLPHKDAELAERRWVALRDRVRKIPAPYGLIVRNATAGMPGPEHDAAKRIARQLREWLLAPSTAVRDVLTVESYTFQVGVTLPSLSAEMILPLGGSWVNSDELKPIISEKVSQYAPMARSHGAPLVVVLAADHRVPVSDSMVRSVLNGELAVSVTLNPDVDGGYSSGPLSLHQTNRPPTWDTGLSAVGWLAPGTPEPGTLTIFRYPLADLPHGVPLGSSIVEG